MGLRHEKKRERAVFVGALAATLGHELQAPLNLFRLLVEQLERGAVPDAEDVGLLREELEHLIALNRRLRTLANPPRADGVLSLREWVERAAAGVQIESATGLEIGALPELRLAGDPQLLVVALTELFENALEHRRAGAGVYYRAPELVVWDDGPGFGMTLGEAQAFGTRTGRAAAGLGLLLAQRAFRSHGLSLSMSRLEARTELSIVLGAAAMASRGDV
jgi:signal transduction histidine kinase